MKRTYLRSVDVENLQKGRDAEEMSKLRGKLIHRTAVQWLEENGYEVPVTTLKDQMSYFGTNKVTLYEVMAMSPLYAEYAEVDRFINAVAHQIHEIVEINEIKMKYGYIDRTMKMREIGAYEYAHPIAQKWDWKFLEEKGYYFNEGKWKKLARSADPRLDSVKAFNEDKNR